MDRYFLKIKGIFFIHEKKKYFWQAELQKIPYQSFSLVIAFEQTIQIPI